jgi:RNA polymerase sigma factor (sigma-70 family)
MPSQTSRYTAFDSAELYAACCSTTPSVQATAYTTLWMYLYQIALQVVYDQPEAEALAQDCAQIALVRVHERLEECQEPAAFRIWTRRIVSHIAIDELRRGKRLLPIERDESGDVAANKPVDNQPAPDDAALERIGLEELRKLISQAPITDRSRRVVLGCYLDNIRDEKLAQTESELVGRAVWPSHIQVTRSKNIAKLRDWGPLQSFLRGTN